MGYFFLPIAVTRQWIGVVKSAKDKKELHSCGFRAAAEVLDERGDGFFEVVVRLDADKVNGHALEEFLGRFALAFGFAGECFAEGGIAGID